MKLPQWLQKLILGSRESVYEGDRVRFDPGKYSPLSHHRDIVFVPAARDWGTVTMIGLMTDRGPIVFRANEFGQWEEITYTALIIDNMENSFLYAFLNSWEETNAETT